MKNATYMMKNPCHVLYWKGERVLLSFIVQIISRLRVKQQ